MEIKPPKKTLAGVPFPNSGEVTYNTISEYRGYSAKLDPTNLPPGVLIAPSQNVRSTPGNRVGNRSGWTLDGQADPTDLGGIKGAFDWDRHTGDARHLRSYTTAGFRYLQFRYVATAGDYWNGFTFAQDEVFWVSIINGDTSTQADFNFADFWDSTNFMSLLLMVNGEASIRAWYGGVTTIASSTVNTITKTGTTTWAEEGFPPTGSVLINNTPYAYTGGTGTTTLTGVTPDPTGEPIQSLVISDLIVTPVGSLTNMALPFLDIIGIRNNQVYLGQYTNRQIYVSQVNSYTDYTFSSPQRITGEGAILTLDGNPIGFAVQENAMYITAGKNQWYETLFTIQGDNGVESLSVIPLKTGSQQAAQSQALMWKSPNDVMFVTNEPTLSSLGRVQQVVLTPQITNISDPIKLDFDTYDFTGGSGIYDRYFHYIAVPANNIWLIFNVAKGYWEAPQTGSFSRWSIIDGELYGHSSLVPETYKMNTGYTDNGAPINSVLALSWQNFGTRVKTKRFDTVYLEGYIDPNGSLALTNRYDIDGCMSTLTKTLQGNDPQFVCLIDDEGSLGKESLGKLSLGGGSALLPSAYSIPPKFRWFPTFQNPKDFYEWSPVLISTSDDFSWELLCIGPNVMDSPSQDQTRKD